jgi:phosphatidylserine/phosphatidylglycerophosphate/cardiolipin synthase-like enzyme
MVADQILHLFGFNFTHLDMDKSRSFAIATRDRRTVKDASVLFEADCSRQTYAPTRSNLVVSPETARSMLARFIRDARRTLAIYDLKIQDRDMLQLLDARAKKGVQVRVLGAMKGGTESVEVRALKGRRLHVRAIIRDGTRAFVGSQGLRTPELDLRREVGLLISNPSVTRKLMQVFEEDWAASASEPKKEDKKEEKQEAKAG